jgi:hypothetical protein
VYGPAASDTPRAEERSAGDHNRQLKADATAFNKIAASDSPLEVANLIQLICFRCASGTQKAPPGWRG